MRWFTSLAILVKVAVAVFHIAAASTAPMSLLKPAPLVPPVTSTVPSGRVVALWWRRENCIGPAVDVHDGDATFRSIVSHVLVGGSPPPKMTYLPSPYCTEALYERWKFW